MLRKTKQVPACRIADSFSSYILSKRLDPECSLTTVPYQKMTRILGPGEYANGTTVDLGFTFWFNGIEYSSIIVSTQGFITLGTAGISNYLSNDEDPTSIKPVISAVGALICPWWIDSLTVPEEVPTYGPLGGVYYYKEHSPEGVRGIVRWVSNNYLSTPTNVVLIYECVLYEGSGKIEFRYAPKIIVDNYAIATSVAEPAGYGGVTGIWTTGTVHFRDFTHEYNTPFGGATASFAFSYTEGAGTNLPWKYDRRAIEVTTTIMIGELVTTGILPATWPAIATCAIWAFEPLQHSTKNLPRVDVRVLDSTPYENSSIRYFNDRKTLIYGKSDDQHVDYPTTFTGLYSGIEGSPTSLINRLTSLSSSTGNVTKAADYWMQRGIVDEKKRISPFDESSLTEQGPIIKGTSFYTTGSDANEYIEGYTQNIGAKKIIRLSLPILSETLLRPTTSSMYYYDPTKKAVLEYGTAIRKDPGDLYAPGVMADSLGFTPLGTIASQIVSESYDRHFTLVSTNNESDMRHDECASGFGIAYTAPERRQAMMFSNTNMFTVSPSMDVARSGTIHLDSILDKQFLIEKVIFDIPLAAGPGWTQDTTRTKRTTGFDDYYVTPAFPAARTSATAGSLCDVVNDWPIDVGGPCVTVGLMNQTRAPTHAVRDLIVSGTIIPKIDDSSSINIEKSHVLPIVDFNDGSHRTLTHYSITQQGFRAFNLEPGAVVVPNAAGYFTGSVTVPLKVMTSNGFTVWPRIMTGPSGSSYFAKAQTANGHTPGDTAFEQNDYMYYAESNKMTMMIQDANGVSLSTPTIQMGEYGNEFVTLETTYIYNGITAAQPGLGSRIASTNPLGRSQFGFTHTGRSIRDMIGVTSTNVKNVLYPFKDQISSYISSIYALPNSSWMDSDGATQSTDRFIPDVVTVVESQQYAPYLVDPKDELIFFMSKCRPIKSASLSMLQHDSGTFDAFSPGDITHSVGRVYATLTGSHDIRVISGTLNITLIGSYVKENQEHDSVGFNERLYSPAISDVIGNDAIIDQTDSEYTPTHEGTYLDDLITGSLLSFSRNLKSYIIGERAKVYSSVKANLNFNRSDSSFPRMSSPDLATSVTPVRELCPSIRFSQAHDARERFYDTLLPSLSDIWTTDGIGVFDGSLYSQVAGPTTITSPAAMFYLGPVTDPRENSSDASPFVAPYYSTLNMSNLEWQRAFPWEPRYSSLARFASPFQSIKTSKSIDWSTKTITDLIKNRSSAVITMQGGIASLVARLQFPYRFGLNIRKYSNVGGAGNQYGITYSDQGEFLKVAYGYSSRDPSNPGAAGLGSVNNGYVYVDKLIGHPMTTKYRGGIFTIGAAASVKHHVIGVTIEGWKYGILNGFRQTSKSIFRRDRYGQYRDMLEQRMDGKFFYEFVGSTESSATTGSMMTMLLNRGAAESQSTITAAPVSVKFIDVNGRLTSPEKTDSNNLSLEATSSLPYFDGEFRNRPSITPIFNQTMVVGIQDKFGNLSIS